MSFAVLLNEMIDISLNDVAPVIADASENIILADATRALRDMTGFLAKNLPRQDANNIANALNNIGIGCFVMDMDRMHRPLDHQVLNVADVREDSLVVSDLYGRQTPLSWSNLVYISIGRILPHKKNQFRMGSNLEYDIHPTGSMTMPAGRGGRFQQPSSARKKTEMTKTMYVLDLFFKNPQEVHLRISSDAFSYAYLGQRIAMSSNQNFKMLVQDVVSFAPQVFGNKGTSAFLNEADQKYLNYKDTRVFDEENLWMLQLVYMNLNQQES